MKHQASWSNGSIPFIVEDQGEMIAHAGVWPMTMMLNGKVHHTAAIHAVCVKEEHRGKGYFKQLMQEVMQYVDHHFESSLLFTTKPYLYRNYPYKIMLPEYDFVVSKKISLHSKSNDSDMRIINLDNPDDLKLTYHLLSNRLPLSDQLSIIHENGNALFIFNVLHKNLHYSEKLNTLIVFEITNNTLYIKEIISQTPCQITDIIRLIPGDFNKVVLQFCPDRFLDEKEYEAILAAPESCMMTSKSFLFQGKYFRYPELYAC